MRERSKSATMCSTNVDSHAKYLKEFRVEQCPLFIQRKCTQHRPFTCFNWHFMNQRRRRPSRRRDRTFNYSADNYCAKYDETTGICPDGDECPNLHRTAGDTERRYHLRYYKTCMCVHDTDARGFCVKNGPHCAFAHGNHDLRSPVYDIKELQAMENPELDPNGTGNGPNILDKERNLMNEDPKWQDTTYVLSNYKTEPCKRPPRLCRQGYACPQYHNSKDKRRSPRKYKYRSTPCPNVKHGEEWGEPGNCDQGDNCVYCHTRTEQQFHPEIYKSTKCNDVQQAGYCPRGVFCAFAHVDLVPAEDLTIARDVVSTSLDCGTNLVDLLSNALPPDKRHDKDKTLSDSSLAILQNGSGEVSESASTSSLGSNGSQSKAPGSQLHHNNSQHKLSSMLNYPSLHQANEIRKQLMAIDADPLLTKAEKAQKKQNLCIAYNLNSMTPRPSLSSPLSNSFFHNDTVESVVGNALDDLHLDDPLGLIDSVHRETNSPISNSISAGLASSGLLSSSAPVNIPGMAERSVLSSFSPSTSSPLQPLHSASSFLTAGSRFSHQDSIESTMSSFMNQVSDPFSNHVSQSSGTTSKLGAFNNSLFDFSNNQGMSPSSRNQPLGASPLVNVFSISPSNNNTTGSLSELQQVQRLRDELTSSRAQLASWDERINQARVACNAWQIECEESKRKTALAEQQRDEALIQLKALKAEKEAATATNGGGSLLNSLGRTDYKSLSISALKSMQSQFRTELEEIEKALYRETATKCMVCEEQNRAVTLSPCNHYVVCSTCAPNQRECPYCQTPVVSTS